MKRAWSTEALWRRLRGFSGDESGQSLLVMALTIFGLVITTMLIVGVGEVTTEQIRLQHAADAAAYAGAQIQADCMSQIAWCNEAMAAVYARLVRLAVDNTVMAVQAELANPEPWWQPTVAGLPAVDSVLIPGTNPGVATQQAQVARDLAEEWIPRGEIWLRRLSRVQRAIAIMGPSLIEHQVWHTAQANYYTDRNRDGSHDKLLRIALWPHAQFYPDEPQKVDLNIFKIGEAGEYPNGWRLTSNTHPYFVMEASHLTHAATEGTLHDGTPYTSEEDRYHLTVTNNTDGGIHVTTIEPYIRSWSPHNADRWTQHFTWTDDEGQSQVIIVMLDGDGDEFYVINGVVVVPQPNGVTVGGTTYGYDANGNMTINGVPVANATTIEVNGVQVPVQGQPYIPVGPGRMTMNCVYTYGNMEVSFRGEGIRIRYGTPAGMVNVTDDTQARINWLTTAEADGRWVRRGHHHSAWGWENRHRHDRRLHRMCTIEEGAQFLYESVLIGTHLKDMDMIRLASHGIHRNNDWSDAGEPTPRWRVPDQGLYPEVEHDATIQPDTADYVENASGLWAHYPLWARPQRDPDDPADRNFGGFFDIAAGRPHSPYSYSQTRVSPYVAMTYGVNPYLDMDQEPMSPGRYAVIEWVEEVDPDNPDGGVGYWRVTEQAHPYTRVVYHPEGVPDELVSNVYPARTLGAGGAPGFWIERFATREQRIARQEQLMEAFRSVNRDVSTVEIEGLYFTQPFVPFRDPRDGEVKLQVFCPLGSMPKFRRAPRYYNPAVPLHVNPADSGDVEAYRLVMQGEPAYVRRYIQHAYERYNDALVRRPVSRRSMDQDYNARTWEGSRDFFSVVVDFDNPTTFQAPLQATSEVFRRGTIVGVHAPESISWLSNLLGGADTRDRDDARRGVGLVNPLRITAEPGEDSRKWTSGTFAFSAARVFVRAPDGRMITNFAPDNAALGTDMIGRQVSAQRQAWLGSDHNLFEPSWTAALVPIRDVVRLEDVYWPDEIEERDDNAVAFVMRQFFGRRSGGYNNWWRLSITESGHGQIPSDRRVHRSVESITAPPMQRGREGRRLFTRYESLDIDDLVRH